MYEIAQGIKVYYENKKNFRNVVFFSDNTYKYYDTGAMIFEIISEEASYMLITKVQNMINAFPEKTVEANADSIVDGFKWLYGTIEDEDMPVATELFRSCFDDAIKNTCNRIAAENITIEIGQFLLECFDEYLDHILTFIEFLESIAASASGLADSRQQEIAQVFIDSSGELFAAYSKKCRVRKSKDGVIVETTQITNLLQLLTFEYCRLRKENKLIKQCVNCGRIFIPRHRSDTLFCDAPSPQNSSKTCKVIGPQINRQRKRSENPSEREHFNILGKNYNNLRRAKARGDSEDIIKYYRKAIDNEFQKYAEMKEGEIIDE